MTEYKRLADGVNLTEQQVRADFPNTSFPAVLPCPDGYAVVFPAPVPEYDPITQYYRRVEDVKINGGYQQAFQVTQLDAEQIAANRDSAQAALISSVTQLTQQRLDAFARTRNYDGILSACTYANSTNPTFKVEGDYCVAKRDETWGALYTIMAAVQAGTHAMPSGYADIEPELPVLTWPT